MKYPLSSRVLHWLMSVIVLFLLGLGIYMADFLSKESPNRMEIYDLHKSLGVVVLILVFLRIINRLIFRAPALPVALPKYEKILAHITHYSIYLLLILIPLSGYLMSNSFGFPVHLFSVEMPVLVQKNFELAPLFAELHEIFAYSLIGLLALHIAGVIKHRFFDLPENDSLKRMI